MFFPDGGKRRIEHCGFYCEYNRIEESELKYLYKGFEVTLTDGGFIKMIDYQSVGKILDETSLTEAWVKIQSEQ